MEGNARSGPARPSGRRCANALWAGALSLVLILAWSAAATPASGDPASPLVIDEAATISGPRPWISPTGEQLVTYLRREERGLPLAGLSSRIDGGPFTRFEALSTRPAITPPLLGFGPDGTALLAWGSSGTASLAEQTLRPPGGPPEPAGPAGECDGPVSIAVSASGRVLSGCPANSGLLPGWSGLAGAGLMPFRIAPELELGPATENPGIRPFTAWGSDGTGVVAIGLRTEGAPGERRIEARVIGPGSTWDEETTVASVPAPGLMEATGAAVLPNGTVAITALSDGGGVLFIRPPGPGKAFEQVAVGRDTASMPSADQWGRLHFLASTEGEDGASSWWVIVRNPDGSLREPIPVPTEGKGARPVENGLQVFPNGAEAIVTRSESGFYVAFRVPGGGAFSIPRRLASATNAGPGAVARTSRGDLLLAWERSITPTTRQLLVGGWDSGARPVIGSLSIPKRVRRGARSTFSVAASDTMGISRIVWKFPGDREVEGRSVKVRLTRRGENVIKVSVFDRAGGRSVRYGAVQVVTPGGGLVQGRSGTSGSLSP